MPPSPKPDPIQQRLAAIEQQLQALQRSQNQATLTITRQLEAFIQLHSLIGPIPGLLHSWPVSADFALHMLRLLLAQPPELVLEFGSGTSTALLLQALALANPHCTGSAQGARSAPQMLTFEHLAHYHQLTAELIAPCRLRRHAQLLLAPLEPWSDASGSYSYYSQLERISAAAAALRRKRQRPLRQLLVIEFGSGTSTALLLQALALANPHCSGSAQGARSAPQLLTFEHLAHYHQLTAELIAPCRLRRHAHLLLAPLEPWSDASGCYSYYGQLECISTAATALRRKRQRPLRQLLVIVDGPPGATGPQARYPALPVLLEAIPADPAHPLQITLLLDDLHRPEEQAVAAAWQALLTARGIAATRRDHAFEKWAMELPFAL
jgi:hypothetical protein